MRDLQPFHLKIKQVASSIIISLSNTEATPGEEFTIGAEVFDQSGKEIIGTVSARVISPDNEETVVAIPTGDFSTFDFPINASAGLWRIIAIFNGIEDLNDFDILREICKPLHLWNRIHKIKNSPQKINEFLSFLKSDYYKEIPHEYISSNIFAKNYYR